ncbi:MAG: nucleotidyltransferase family protein [Gammaproteobacteria bacterium]|nr:nucleotidyltransferase family protein [Gammaproteobacteria bacterium]
MQVLLREVLARPGVVVDFSQQDWALLIRQARAAFLLARVDYLLVQHELQFAIPPAAVWHFEAARVLFEKQKNSVRWEIHCLKSALAKADIQPVFLKGAAYVMAELPPMHGRIFSDVDIMVPADRLERAERALILNGWIRKALDRYDQMYYRKWMHELPPLISRQRNTVTDLHHTILPPTARLKVKTELLFASAIEQDGAYRLSPLDMVIHSATHLFCDGELEHGMRDLVDLDALMREFSQLDPGFWQALVNRAGQLGLGRPVFYALRYVHKILLSPVPEETLRLSSKYAPIFPRYMDLLFHRGLMPEHASCRDSFTGIARWVLYVRSHYLRMPIYRLLPHLIRKAWKRRFQTDTAAA